MTDVQGTKVLIAAKPVPMWADCHEALDGLHAGVEVLCPQSLGDLGRTREKTDTSCEGSKTTGAMSYEDFAMELLLDRTDLLGQHKLTQSFEDNKPLMIGLVAANGDVIFTEAVVSGDGIAYPADGLIGYNVTVAPYGGFNKCSAIVPSDCSKSIGGTTVTEYNLGGFLFRDCKIFKA